MILKHFTSKILERLFTFYEDLSSNINSYNPVPNPGTEIQISSITSDEIITFIKKSKIR